jgi:type IV pilus assembly protein PilY1
MNAEHDSLSGAIGCRLSAAIRKATITIVFCQLPLATVPSYAALMDISQTPLFLQNAVQPNIFLMLDDSGSMNWETLYNDGTGQSNSSGTSTLDRTPNSETERLQLCYGYNTLAYNPGSTYTPWKGKDSAGVEYKDAWLYGGGTDTSPNWNIRQDPYNSGSATTNIATTTSDGSNEPVAYYAWTDADSDGQYDWSDPDGDGTRDDTECGDVTNTGNGSPNTKAVKFGSMATSDQKNYANWYMYYRKREYVLKRAVSELVKNSKARVGLSTLWRNAAAANSLRPGFQIADIDDISVPVDTAAQTAKNNLLDHVSRIESSNGTPLRTALDNVGKYYEGISQTALFGSAPNHTGTVSALSPILNAGSGGVCQQNFTVLMTDGYYNSGYTGTTVGNADGDNSSNGIFDSQNTGAAARPYGDDQSNTLGDIAMHYYERDLWPNVTMANKVPYTPGVDPKTEGTKTPNDTASDDTDGTLMHQHMVTFTVAFGLSGNLDPFDETATVCDSDPTDPCWTGWPNQTPTAMEDTAAAVDDLWHAAYNGRGQFLSAKSPSTLISQLNAAFAAIDSRTGTASSVSASASGVTTSTRVYSPQFTSGTWSGGLVALEFKKNASKPGGLEIPKVLVDVNDWGSSPSDAGEILKTLNWSSDREIVTWNGTNGVAFRWGNLTASQQTLLNTNASTSTNDGLGQDRLEYIRGNHAKEKANGGGFRDRSGGYVLGDIVNSAAVYVRRPSFGYSDGFESAPYSTFRSTYTNRVPMVYVGANDGMLHGFAVCKSASDPGCSSSDLGREKIAFVPSRIMHKLSALTDPAYQHAYYVDGTPTIGDAFISTPGCSGGGKCWRTMLVAGLRGGGQGVFALDITNPSAFNEGSASQIVRWEFTDADDADLGYTYSQPVIAKLHNGAWAAIFGNGYNNSEADGNASTSGHAALFIVNLETGALIRKIDVPVGDTTTPNGLATPAVIDHDGDKIADFAYAGDVRGNLWKFDLTHPSDTSQWKIASVGGLANKPLFTAMDADSGGNPQPITSRPEIIPHPAGVGGFMILFGTGKYIEGSGIDIGNSQVQTFYGIWDVLGGDTDTGSGTGTNTAVARSKLRSQTLTDATVGSQQVRTISDNSISKWGNGGSSGEHMGWKVDFNLAPSGERVVSASQYLSSGLILFTTIVPATDPCGFGGDSWIWALKTVNGGEPSFTVFDVNQDGYLTSADNTASKNIAVGVKVGTGLSPTPLVLDGSTGQTILTPGTSGGKPDTTDTIADENKGRQTWRQIQ